MQDSSKQRCNSRQGIYGMMAAAIVFGAGTSVFAAATASDNASNSPYNGASFNDGDNGGTGFNAWSLQTTPNGGFAGFFNYDSTTNGGGGSGAVGSSGGINVNNRSWGFYAGNGGAGNAYRSFTAGANGSAALQLNQQFSISTDNGYIDGGSAGGSTGFALQDATGSDKIAIYFVAGTADYTIYDGSDTGHASGHDSGIGYTDGGLTFKYTVTGINSYSLTVVRNNASFEAPGSNTYTFTGTETNGATDFDITQVHIFDTNGNGGDSHNFYANSLGIVTTPEPASLGLVMVGGLMAMKRRRR